MSNIKCILRCDDTYKEEFKHSQCLTTISVGQQTHEGERFAAAMEHINDSFESCIMLVDDSLQRHTMALNRKEDAAFFYDIAIKEGDLWLARNKKYFAHLPVIKKIIRWGHWLHHPNFLTQQELIKAAIHNDPIYKKAFDTAIDGFLIKYQERLSNKESFDLRRARQLSFDFVLEECTALSLWPELQCQFEVYPNRHNSAIEETRRRFVLSHAPSLLRAVTLVFRNAKQLRPQHFESLQAREA